MAEHMKTPVMDRNGSILDADGIPIATCPTLEQAYDIAIRLNAHDDLVAACRRQMETATLVQDVLTAKKMARPVVVRILRDIAETEAALAKAGKATT